MPPGWLLYVFMFADGGLLADAAVSPEPAGLPGAPAAEAWQIEEDACRPAAEALQIEEDACRPAAEAWQIEEDEDQGRKPSQTQFYFQYLSI